MGRIRATVIEASLPGVKLVQPCVHADERGYFLETWQARHYRDLLGLTADFVQHNQSFSYQNVVRGLHFQQHRGQGKLIRVVQGHIWDVVVDLRQDSPTFGQWLGVDLCGIVGTEEPHVHPPRANPPYVHQQLWVPPGFAHGFAVLSGQAIVEYLCTAYYDAGDEVCLRWNDPDLGIPWPVDAPVLSPKDQQGLVLAELQAQGRLPQAGAGWPDVPGRAHGAGQP